jgi:hypothetical protein
VFLHIRLGYFGFLKLEDDLASSVIFLFLKDMDVFLEFVEGATTDDELVLILDCFDCIRVLLLVKIDFDFE